MRRTGPRCSSRRQPLRSSAGPASAAWPTSCARPSRRCLPIQQSRPEPDQMLLPVRGAKLPPVEIGAVYTIGLNYRDPDNPNAPGPERPLVYGKASSSVIGGSSVISWDRSLTANVNGECELGIVIGESASVL